MAGVSVDDVHLFLADETVDFVGVDSMVTLRFSNGASTAFESPFTVREAKGAPSEVIPDGDKASLVPALRLLTQTVRAARIDEGTLEMTFSNGVVLRAHPDAQYESWHYIGPENPPVRVIAVGGGGLFISIPDDRDGQAER
jgi:hypothetical protein